MTASASRQQLLDRERGGEARGEQAAELDLELAQAGQRAVEHDDVGAHADGDAGRARAGDPAADDEHARGRHAGHAAHQHAARPAGLARSVDAATSAASRPATSLIGASSGSAPRSSSTVS